MSESHFYSDTRGSNLFGYRVQDDSMMPAFEKGDIAVVNPNLEAREGDFVVIRRGAACSLRLFVKSEPNPLLAAIKSAEPPFPANSAVILGRVVERRRSYW